MIEPTSYAEVIIRLLVSLAFGVVLGFERETKATAAGLRTHALVALGATIFTLASIFFSGPNVDMSRIAGQIVVGIGFIGAGVIYKSQEHIFGLSTAASLWVAAGLGLLAGIGEFFVGTIALVLAITVLVGGIYIEQKMLHKKKPAKSF
ncbi:MAG: MgtC/SapB family protein [Candidatus Woesearchaeota archaeon]